MSAALEPDRDQIEIFVDALFRHASREGFASLRSFFEDQDRAFQITACSMSGGVRFLVDRAEECARVAAQAERAVVFCPPVATFAKRDRAREQDIAEGLALSVELDKHPQQARRVLEDLLGPATVVVVSGGIWVNGGAASEDKLHLHWRLRVPARGTEALARLKEARTLATRIVGADASNVPACHPIRWPGSWHRKAAPRMCAIDTVWPDIEIDLDAALARLRETAGPQETSQSGTEERETPPGGDWATLLHDILSGESFHVPLTRLAMKLLRGGTKDGAAVGLLRGWLEASTAPRDRRWQQRWDYIPRAVRTARTKIDEEEAKANATAASLGEWDAGVDPGPIPPREWLLANQFCRGFISSIVAAGGTGKTALRLLQFISLALGRSLCGQHVFRRCRVLLVSLEEDHWELQRRIKAVLDHYGISRGELSGWLFCATPRGLRIAELHNRARVTGPLAQHLRAAIERRRPDVVSLDPFVKMHGLEENSSGDMNFVCDLLAALAVEYNVAVDSPHHVHKGTLTPGDADSGRGSSGIRDAGRLVYTLAPMAPEEAERFNIAAQDRCQYVRLDSAKMNIAARSGNPTWFRLVGVPIGNASPEYPNGDTVHVAEPWSPPSAWNGTTVQGLNLILDAIALGLVDDDGRPTGQRYSNAPNAGDRAAWPVVQRTYPEKTEAACREIIHAWLATGLLSLRDYDDLVQRKPRQGLYVDDTKRPS